ncbi:Ribonuclease 3 [Candidatus Entotheonellaceae bacterium PAL068K]
MNTVERVALLTRLQERLGYTFGDLTLLNCALTHTSYTHETAAAYGNYERLEFLGDAVLGLIVSAYLYSTYPTANEGKLSKLRARLVSEQGLTAFAQQLELGHFLLLGRGEEQTGGRQKASLLAAGFEAVIAALYLDGGLSVARDVFLRCFGSAMQRRLRSTRVRNYKGLLQQQALSLFGTLPTYRVLHEAGPAHQKTFYVQLTLAPFYGCVGVGRSKKAAEQHAAKQLLEQLQAHAHR